MVDMFDVCFFFFLLRSFCFSFFFFVCLLSPSVGAGHGVVGCVLAGVCVCVCALSLNVRVSCCVDFGATGHARSREYNKLELTFFKERGGSTACKGLFNQMHRRVRIVMQATTANW